MLDEIRVVQVHGVNERLAVRACFATGQITFAVLAFVFGWIRYGFLQQGFVAGGPEYFAKAVGQHMDFFRLYVLSTIQGLPDESRIV
jgi:hypothetical protein